MDKKHSLENHLVLSLYDFFDHTSVSLKSKMELLKTNSNFTTIEIPRVHALNVYFLCLVWSNSNIIQNNDNIKMIATTSTGRKSKEYIVQKSAVYKYILFKLFFLHEENNIDKSLNVFGFPIYEFKCANANLQTPDLLFIEEFDYNIKKIKPVSNVEKMLVFVFYQNIRDISKDLINNLNQINKINTVNLSFLVKSYDINKLISDYSLVFINKYKQEFLTLVSNYTTIVKELKNKTDNQLNLEFIERPIISVSTMNPQQICDCHDLIACYLSI